jgi:uncharacterized protein YdaU (DUF1376 family)
MAEFPYFPLWTDAYLGDTTHLTTTEHGAYLLLLIAMWRTPDKKLPSSDKLLARYCKATTGQWMRMRPTLMPFFRDENGFITQGRLTDEAEAVKRKSMRQSDSANARWLKHKNTSDATAMPNACQTDAPIAIAIASVESAPVGSPKKRGFRLPEDWCPSSEGTALAVSLGLNAQAVLEKFRDYWRGIPGSKGCKLDWEATWRNWCRNDRGAGKLNGTRKLVMV